MNEAERAQFETFIKRRDDIRIFLRQSHPELFITQKHCDNGSAERAYWHHGYQMAITDMLIALGIEVRQP